MPKRRRKVCGFGFGSRLLLCSHTAPEELELPNKAGAPDELVLLGLVCGAERMLWCASAKARTSGARAGCGHAHRHAHRIRVATGVTTVPSHSSSGTYSRPFTQQQRYLLASQGGSLSKAARCPSGNHLLTTCTISKS